MNLLELHNMLTPDEILLGEGLMDSDPELRGLISSQLTKPLLNARKQAITTIVPKLRGWAQKAMDSTSRTHTDYQFIQKVLNNTETVANQLVDSLNSRKSSTAQVAPSDSKSSIQNTWIRASSGRKG